MTFDDFVASELDALSRYARLLCGDRQSGHDLVADTLVIAAGRWHHIGELDAPLSYVRRMLTNRHIDHLRRRRLFGPPAPLPEEHLTEPVDGTSGVEQRAFLDALLRTLPARQRAALVCRYYLGLSDQEIADELGIGSSSVRSAITRGLAAIRTRTTTHDVRSHLR